MRQHFFAIVAAVAFAASSVFAAEVTVKGATYYAYANANWGGVITSTQVVFLDTMLVDPETDAEAPFNCSETRLWDLVKESIAAGNMAASISEQLQFEAINDTIADGELEYIVTDRGDLAQARYSSLRKAGSRDTVVQADLPDSLAVAIVALSPPDSLLVAPHAVMRLKAAFREFLTVWQAPQRVPLTREQYNALTGGG